MENKICKTCRFLIEKNSMKKDCQLAWQCCGEFEYRYEPKYKPITIHGHWNENYNEFIYECAIGQYDGFSNDDDIFYWFDDESFVHGDHGDFTVDYYIDDKGNYSKVPPSCPECNRLQYKDFENQTVHICEHCAHEIRLINS
jgi:hypothetical protein